MLFEGERRSSYLLGLAIRSEWKFDLPCVCLSSDNLGICHVRRPVSQDRRISAIELEAGKPAHVAYF